MKTIDNILAGLYHVISEPGDATRYDYFVLKIYDDYSIMPGESSFRFPQKLNYYAVQNLSEEELISLAKEEYCNPYTLKECIRTINELQTNFEEKRVGL